MIAGQEWRRQAIQAAIPAVIQVAISRLSTSTPTSPANIDSGPSTSMPMAMPASICR